MVKVTYQGQSENSLSFQIYVAHTVVQAGGLHSTEMRSCLFYVSKVLRWCFPFRCVNDKASL